MKLRTKLLISIALISAILVPMMVLYEPASATYNGNGIDKGGLYSPDSKWPERPRWRLILKFLRNCESETVSGTIVAFEDRMLVVNVDGEHVRVIMPQKWTGDEGVFTVKELVENGIIVPGEEIVIETLVGYIRSDETLTVYIQFGYEMEVGGQSFYALLPFNIEE